MNDLDRLRKEYEDRQRRFGGSDLYSLSNPAYRFLKSQLREDILKLLEWHCANVSWDSMHMLEVGCGNGNVLMDFHQFGVKQENLIGVDLLLRRLKQAHNEYPLLKLACADGQYLPYSTRTFDLVVQFTAFSSILDYNIKRNLALEMQRVLKKDGAILWYDFWWNPTNYETRGIGLREIRSLFHGMQIHARKVTLAPPIARSIIPLSLSLCTWLESLSILNSHYLALIKPATKVSS